MKSLAVAVLAGTLVGSAFGSPPMMEAAMGHDWGLVHPEPDDGSHAHGDADDHHETPDSPCHHHDLHSCADAGGAAGLLPDSLPGFSRVCERFEPAEPSRFCEPFIRTLFHVPLA